MINFTLLGTGRIGKLHASIINDHPEASLKYVYDIDTSSAKNIAKKAVKRGVPTITEFFDKKIENILKEHTGCLLFFFYLLFC